MKRKSTVLTGEERDALVLGALHLNGKHLSNAEIGQRLGVSANRVKTIIHQACVKLGAHSRNEAVLFALKRGKISLNELCSLDELAERFSSLGSDMLRRIAHLIRQGLENGRLPGEYEQIIRTDRRQDTVLTESEREVLLLAGFGLTNREIADRLYISISSVRTFLYRAYTKLGTRRRADAVVLAVKQGEISAGEIFSPNELMQILAPLGAESLEKIAQLMDQKHGQEPLPTDS